MATNTENFFNYTSNAHQMILRHGIETMEELEATLNNGLPFRLEAYKEVITAAIKAWKQLGGDVVMSNEVKQYVATVAYIKGYNGRHYDFKTTIPLKSGDVVVVDSANGLGLAEVVGVKTSSKMATRWVVQKVDLSEHEARIEKEKKRKSLERQMEARFKKAEKLTRYQMLAANDPEMARLLKEYSDVAPGELIWDQSTSNKIDYKA